MREGVVVKEEEKEQRKSNEECAKLAFSRKNKITSSPLLETNRNTQKETKKKGTDAKKRAKFT